MIRSILNLLAVVLSVSILLPLDLSAQECTKDQIDAFKRDIKIYEGRLKKAERELTKSEKTVAKLFRRTDKIEDQIAKNVIRHTDQTGRARQSCESQKKKVDSDISKYQSEIGRLALSCLIALNPQKCMRTIDRLNTKIGKNRTRYRILDEKCNRKYDRINQTAVRKDEALQEKLDRFIERRDAAVDIFVENQLIRDQEAAELKAVEDEFMATCPGA